MLKEIQLKDRTIQYNLIYKNVKNINLRIKPDGSLSVSANRYVSENMVDDFLKSKATFILGVLEKFENSGENTQYFSDKEIKNIILNICDKVYPYYREKGIDYPTIKFRKMTSRWGSCHTKKRTLTFNTNLMYAPIHCTEYVVHHEFTHFIVPNHSQKFYEELSKSCPDWKCRRQELKKIILK